MAGCAYHIRAGALAHAKIKPARGAMFGFDSGRPRRFYRPGVDKDMMTILRETMDSSYTTSTSLARMINETPVPIAQAAPQGAAISEHLFVLAML